MILHRVCAPSFNIIENILSTSEDVDENNLSPDTENSDHNVRLIKQYHINNSAWEDTAWEDDDIWSDNESTAQQGSLERICLTGTSPDAIAEIETLQRLKEWYKNGLVAISPHGNILVLGTSTCCRIFGIQSNSGVSYQGKISDCRLGEIMTSLICLSVDSTTDTTRRTSFTSPMSIILIGYSTGRFRVFTKDGRLLFNQLFHSASLCRVHLRSMTFPTRTTNNAPSSTKQSDGTYIHVTRFRRHRERRYKTGSGSLSDEDGEVEEGNIGSLENGGTELVLLYSDGVVVCVEGSSLVRAILACELEAPDPQPTNDDGIMNKVSTPYSPPLSFAKWRLNKQNCTVDLVALPPTDMDILDKLETRQADKDAIVARYVGVGHGPCAGLYSAVVGAHQYSGVDLGSAVTSKMTNLMFSVARRWGMGGKKRESTGRYIPVQFETPVPLPLVAEADDPDRAILSIAPDLKLRYAALSDNLGRVLLCDLTRLVYLRVWKGYREAQCGWVEVTDKLVDTCTSLKGQRQSVMVLVILAPRRSLLEMWRVLPTCKRIHALDVGAYARLIYTTHGSLDIMGKGNTSVRGCYLLRGSGVLELLSVKYEDAMAGLL
eukprot:CFRG8141T1